MKVKEVIKILEADGWYLARTKGSHRQFKHSQKLGTVTVAGKPSLDVPIGTLKSIWRQAQIAHDDSMSETTSEDFIEEVSLGNTEQVFDEEN